MKPPSSYVFCSIVVIFILLHSYAASLTAKEFEDESEFDYIEGSERGPENWGNIKEEWAICNTGRMQSPIDISDEDVEVINKPGDVTKFYKSANAYIQNRGHDIMIAWERNEAGSIYINGTEYFLQQCHWHSPSEHTINGRRFDLELHVVHQSLDPNVENRIAVFGLLYNVGRPDPFLSKLLPAIISVSGNTTKRDIGVIDPNKIEVNTRKYYRYMGSLTTPPCTEGVIWSVNNVIRTVSRLELHVLRGAVHNEPNARPLQPLNGREIELFDPAPEDASY